MQQSEQRILTTHVGSLPRAPELSELLIRREREPEAAIEGLDAGIDVGNNGEQPRVGFSTYVASRLEGFGGESPRPPNLEATHGSPRSLRHTARGAAWTTSCVGRRGSAACPCRAARA